MSLNYFVEIINGSGEVQTRHKLTDLPIRLGRGYHNDIILDDPHIAAEHAIVEADENGTLNLRDLGSHNAIKMHGKHYTLLSLNGDTIFQLGQTRLRLRTSDYQVPAEIADVTNHRWQGWPLFFIGLAIICAIALSETWYGDISDSKATDYIMSTAIWLSVSAVWVGIWSLANRVFGGSANFSRHLFTLGCGLVALDVIDYLSMFMGFGFSLELFTRYSSHLQIIAAGSMVYYHLRHISPHKRRGLKMICAGLVLLASGLTLIKNYQGTNQYSDELYMHDMLPPALRLSRDHSLDELNNSVSQLKATIDAEREKALKGKAQKNKTELKKQP